MKKKIPAKIRFSANKIDLIKSKPANSLVPASNEKYFTLLLVVFAVAGLMLFIYDTNKDIAGFSIVSKDTALKNAKEYLSSQESIDDISQYKAAITFYEYENTNALLLKEFGEKKAEEYLKEHNLAFIQYQVRFFKESEIEEYYAYLNAENGKVIGFAHVFEESAELPTVSKEKASKSALSFLKENGYSPETLKEQSYSAEQREKRLDHFFTFAFKNSEMETGYGQTKLLIDIGVIGDKVGEYSQPYLFIPEEFSRAVDSQFGLGGFLAWLSILASLLMVVLASIVLIRGLIKGKSRIYWRFFILIAIIMVLILFLDEINWLPFTKNGYTTELPFAVFIATTLLVALFGAILFAAFLLISGSVGEEISRKIWPEKVSYMQDMVAKRYLTKNLANSIFKGYLVALFFVGITVLIYMVGEKYLGVWWFGNAADFNYLISFFPAFSIFVLAFTAAIDEEFTYRMFGISFFKRHLKSTFFAVLIPTVIWAFAHSSYPVFPFYFRGLELLIGGFLFSYFFLRYGIIAVIVAHYAFNSLVTLPILLIGGSTMLIVSHLFVLFLPLMIGFFALKKSKYSGI